MYSKRNLLIQNLNAFFRSHVSPQQGFDERQIAVLRRHVVRGRPVVFGVVERSTEDRSQDLGRSLGRPPLSQRGFGSSPPQNLGCKTFGMISEVGLINDCPLQHLSLNCSSISVIYKITLDPLVHTVFVFYT